MPIQNVIINSTDVARTVDFYTKFLDAELVGEPTADRAVLDLVTATLELRAVGAAESTWVADDLQRGFRHVGFKVDRVDPRADVLKSADVPFHLDPLNAEGGVRICFFYDPDGTLLELVEGDLQYAQVLDAEGVAAERALGVPERPRFDHVAVTVADRAATDAFYAPLGFSFIGTIEQPHDPRGFHIGYLKSGATVLEVFTYETALQDRAPQPDAPGFGWAQIAGAAPTSGVTPVVTASGDSVLADPDGFLFAPVAGVARVSAPGSDDWVRPLGGTGLQVTAVAVGGAPLGSMPENFGHELSYDDGVALAAYVLDSPVRVLDTANGYSGGESERRIGAAVRARGGLPEDFLVATKVDARGRDYSGARVRASVAESQQRLGLDHLPLVFLHDPEFHDFDELSGPGGAVETLMALRDEGVVGHVGLAGGTAPEMQRYLALGGFEVLLVHYRWTLVDRSATELLAQAEDLGVAVVNAAVYGGGILAKPGSTTKYGYREASPVTLAAVDAMQRLCAEHGTDLATAALQASVRDPRVSMTVVGLSRPARLDALVSSLGVRLPDDLFDALDQLRPPREHWLDAQPA